MQRNIDIEERLFKNNGNFERKNEPEALTRDK